MIISFSLILFYIFTISLCVYYIFIFSKILFHKTNKTHFSPCISVIICAKNEEKNLTKNLKSILNQDYKCFEVIVVNDNSTDNSSTILNKYKKENSLIDFNIISINNGNGNKKNALSVGIRSAKYEYILLTDADCKINSNQWIKKIANSFKDKEIILGYGAYKKEKSLLNKLIRFETLLTAIQYFSYALNGITYMAVGRNLAYKKDLFIKNKGFISHQHILSGDDDLFIQEVSTKDNTTICLNPNTFTISNPPASLQKWITQKQRHITTANKYKFSHQILLGYFYTSTIFFWITLFFLIGKNYNSAILITLFSIKTIIQLFIYGKFAKKLNEKDLIKYIPFLELFLICFQLYIFGKNCIKKPENW